MDVQLTIRCQRVCDPDDTSSHHTPQRGSPVVLREMQKRMESKHRIYAETRLDGSISGLDTNKDRECSN